MPKGRLALAGGISAEKAKLYGLGEVVKIEDTGAPALQKDVRTFRTDLTGESVQIPEIDYTNRLTWYIETSTQQLPTLNYKIRTYDENDPSLDLSTIKGFDGLVVLQDGIIIGLTAYMESETGEDVTTVLKVDANLDPEISKTVTLRGMYIDRIGSSIFALGSFGRDIEGLISRYDGSLVVLNVNNLDLMAVKGIVIGKDPLSSGAPSRGGCELHRIIEVPDGYLLFGRYGYGLPNFMVIKVDNNFNLVWAKGHVYESSAPRINISDIKKVTDGVILVGRAYDVIEGSGFYVGIVLKFDFNGNVVAARRIYTTIGTDRKVGLPWIDTDYTYFPLKGRNEEGSFILKFNSHDLSVETVRLVAFPEDPSGSVAPLFDILLDSDSNSLILADGMVGPTNTPARIVSIDATDLTTVNWAREYVEMSSDANIYFVYPRKVDNGYATLALYDAKPTAIGVFNSVGNTSLNGTLGDISSTDVSSSVTVSDYTGDFPPIVEDALSKIRSADLTNYVNIYTLTSVVTYKDSLDYILYEDLAGSGGI